MNLQYIVNLGAFFFRKARNNQAESGTYDRGVQQMTPRRAESITIAVMTIVTPLAVTLALWLTDSI